MAAGGNYGERKVREGTVISDKMQKTVVVAVAANRSHPLYKKTVRRVHRYLAHDETDDCRIGDRVRIVETRPLSRHKRWQVAEVLQRSELPEVAPEAIDRELLGQVQRRQARPESDVAAVSESAAPPEPVAELSPEAVTAEPEESGQ